MMNCTEIIPVHSLQKYTMATFNSGEWVVIFFYNATITFVDSIIKECCLHPGELQFGVCLVFLFFFLLVTRSRSAQGCHYKHSSSPRRFFFFLVVVLRNDHSISVEVKTVDQYSCLIDYSATC